MLGIEKHRFCETNVQRQYIIQHIIQYASEKTSRNGAGPRLLKLYQCVTYSSVLPRLTPPNLILTYTAFHAVHSATKRLLAAGFEEIKERDAWASNLRPGGKYYLTRNGSSIVAFGIGKKWKPGNPIAMVGAHTDSPCLRLKPVSKKTGSGFMQVGVETYGGGIWVISSHLND